MLKTATIEGTVMDTRVDKIKTHFRENKKVYFGTAFGVVVGAIGVISMMVVSKDNDLAAMKITQLGFWNEVKPTTINLVERSNPSKPVHLVGTNLYFNSMSEAARETGHHLSMLSKHLHGQIPDLNGDVFELLEPAA
jgi:hypothetical protein